MIQSFPKGGNMSAIQKWAQDKHFILALVAPQLAMSAQDINILFKDLKKNRILIHAVALPDLSSWFTLYRSHRKTSLFLKELFSGFSDFSSESIEFAEILGNFDQVKRELNKSELKQLIAQMTSEEKTAQIQKMKDIQTNILDESFLDLESDIKGEPVDPKLQADFLAMFNESISGQFYLFVAVPCWLLYRDSATNLYRTARRGDYDSLEKLLRLDALLIHDPSIGKQVQLLRIKGKYSAYENLIESVLKKPKNKSTRKKMKYAIAGLISGISSTIDSPLTEPQIRELFDAIAQDTQKKPVDTDLPDSPEAFSKAIQRDRSYWIKLLKPDKRK